MAEASFSRVIALLVYVRCGVSGCLCFVSCLTVLLVVEFGNWMFRLDPFWIRLRELPAPSHAFGVVSFLLNRTYVFFYLFLLFSRTVLDATKYISRGLGSCSCGGDVGFWYVSVAIARPLLRILVFDLLCVSIDIVVCV